MQGGDAKEPKRFRMTHKIFKSAPPEEFTEDDAPDWLTSRDTVKGSTMDGRWFWEGHVLTLKIGKAVDTDFRRIERVA